VWQPQPVMTSEPAAGRFDTRRGTVTGYGIGVFDLDPGDVNDGTSITMRYYHATRAGNAETPSYELFDEVVLIKERRDSKRG
jgi:hypothetical protein